MIKPVFATREAGDRAALVDGLGEAWTQLITIELHDPAAGRPEHCHAEGNGRISIRANRVVIIVDSGRISPDECIGQARQKSEAAINRPAKGSDWGYAG